MCAAKVGGDSLEQCTGVPSFFASVPVNIRYNVPVFTHAQTLWHAHVMCYLPTFVCTVPRRFLASHTVYRVPGSWHPLPQSIPPQKRHNRFHFQNSCYLLKFILVAQVLNLMFAFLVKSTLESYVDFTASSTSITEKLIN